MIANLKLSTVLAPGLDATFGSLPDAITYWNYLLQKMLRVESQRSSSLIEINVYAQDATLGAAIANEIARVYSDDRINLATSDQREWAFAKLAHRAGCAGAGGHA